MRPWSKPRSELALAGVGRYPWLAPGVLLLLLGALLLVMGGVLLLRDPRELTSLLDVPQLIVLECLLVAVAALGPIFLRLLSRQRLDPLEPGVIFAVVYVMMFSVRPLFIRSSWVGYIERSIMEVFRFLSLQDSDIVLTLFYGLVGVVCFHLGNQTWQDPLSAPARRLAVRPVAVRPWSSRRVTHIAWLGVIFSGISFLLIRPVITQVPVLEEFGRVRQLLVGYGYHGLGMDLLVVLVLILWVDHLRGSRQLLVFPLLIISNVYNLLLGARSGIFNLWIFMYLSYRYLQERKPTWKKTLAGALVVVLAVFSALSIAVLRNEGIRDWGDTARILQDYWFNNSTGSMLTNFMLEFNQFDIFAMIVGAGSQEFPFLWGRTYLDLFYQPIPRALWPDKPWSFDIRIGEMLTGTRTGIPPGMAGELYLNFHVIGIVLGMYLFGRLCRAAYRGALSQPRDPGKVLLYALLLPFLPLLMLRSFMAVGTTALVYLVPALLAIRYIQGGRATP